MSSLVKEDLEKKLFKPLSQNLYEFIEIEFSVQDRYYLCVSGNLFFLLSLQNVNHSKRCGWWKDMFIFIFLSNNSTCYLWIQFNYAKFRNLDFTGFYFRC